MREIKFRAKTKADWGIENKWVIGAAIYFSEGRWWLLVDDNTATATTGTGSYEVIPETVFQYTGLKDINGKEIWEGDIVRYPCGAEYETFYDDEMMSFRLKNGTDIHSLEIESNFELEVVGNIHDNKELLREE